MLSPEQAELCRQAIDRLKQRPGGLNKLAKDLGITRQATSLWAQHGYLPKDHGRLKEIKKLTGIALYELRPDVYDPPPEPPKSNGKTKR